VLVPELPGAALIVRATSPLGGGARGIDVVGPVSASSGPVTLSIPEAPTMVSPDDGATGIGVGAAFTVRIADDKDTCMLRGVREFSFTPEDPSAPRFVVTTAGDEVRVPDTTALGLALPRALRYAVDVTRWASLRDMEDVAAVFDRARSRASISAPRTFTTSP
jgi:hypothetical protein